METGFSDFYHMIYTILKTKFNKVPPKIIEYRDYSKLSEKNFLTDFSNVVNREIPADYNNFEFLIQRVLEQHAPTKNATIRGNNKQHFSKELRKEIMHRSRLKHIANKSGKKEDICRYKQQRNKVVKMNKLAKTEFYRSLDVSNLTNDKRFWKAVKPLFSNKSGSVSQKVTLVENESILSCERQIAECFNHYFINITDSLPIETIPSYVPLRDPIIDAHRKYENHPNVVLIKNKIQCSRPFEFQPISCVDIANEINNLDHSKKTSGALSIEIIKKITGISHTQLAEYYNYKLIFCKFPDRLKAVDVFAIHKASDPTSKVNYRPISVPSAMSKVLE